MRHDKVGYLRQSYFFHVPFVPPYRPKRSHGWGQGRPGLKSMQPMQLDWAPRLWGLHAMVF